MNSRGLVPGLRILRDIVDSKFGSRLTVWGDTSALVKYFEPDHQAMLLNEFLGTRLALAVGVPVPLGEIATHPEGRLAWASALAGSSARDTPPISVKAQRAVKHELMARLLVFDSWINNDDRSDENLIPEGRWSYWAIDHEQAFFGSERPTRELAERLANAPVMRQLDKEAITVPPEFLDREVERIRFRGLEFARIYCDEARLRKISSPEAIECVYHLLTVRADNLGSILEPDFRRCGRQGGGGWRQPITW